MKVIMDSRQWWRAGLKLLWTAYMLLTSLYCLLAFFPYTYYALIKSPVYTWMPWFAHQHVLLYWVALLALAAAIYKEKKWLWYAAVIIAPLTVAGIYITARPFLSELHTNVAAYRWSVAALVAILFLAVIDLATHQPARHREFRVSLAYLPAVLSVITVAVLSVLGQWVLDRGEAYPSVVHEHEIQLGFWSVVTHVVVALLTVSLLNILFAVASKTPWPGLIRGTAIGLTLACGGIYGLQNFLKNALGFHGGLAWLYSVLLVASFLFVGLALTFQLQGTTRLQQPRQRKKPAIKALLVLALVGLGALAIILPSTVGQWDWNGIFQLIFILVLWVAMTGCFYFFGRPRTPYSWPAIVAVILITLATYKVLQLADIYWGKSLGSTDDEIARNLEQYASLDVSFRFTHHLLGNAAREEPCEDLCRILRSYTNIRDAQTNRQIQFVDSLIPTKGKRPNIIMIVVDSMRPDYLGPYNSKVDFTPNIDVLAADSVVFRNTYSQYSGTYLSEPAIWSGAMLLHAQYLRPFENVNGLEKLVNTDGYRKIVSYDNVLREILSPQDDLTRLDTDKSTWRALDFCSTVTQLTANLDAHVDDSRPLFFYAQPQNVHMFASNDHPTWTTSTWRRPGFNLRTALAVHQTDECIGNLLSYLKSHGLYDDSVIVLTSDHGDATGEFGRRAHSYLIYPEVMHVPLIVHMPRSMRNKVTYDKDRVSTLTDITPSLYYLLGHRPIKQDPMLGQPLFAETRQELDSYQRDELFLASDISPIYGILDKGRYMYVTYASPARSYLFDLAKDPNAEHNIVTDALKQHYDQRVIDNLKQIGDYYGYRIGINSLLASRP
ncbi:MAG TPA: sulfatase-like hydrolase/transferase [Candidatus Angelobacter sp.]|jgi:glucan phosphoethanolaminetransferase (alkaline phosphatase superfamily)|nr:sulfatase-like hydrolase/transferase [Candidatus Angelobacter sp.]